MARKKKNDFWDDVEDLNTVSDNDQTGDGIVSGGTCVSLYRL